MEERERAEVPLDWNKKIIKKHSLLFVVCLGSNTLMLQINQYSVPILDIYQSA